MPTFTFHPGVLSDFDFLDFLHALIIAVSSYVHSPSCVWKTLFPCSQLEPLAPTPVIPKSWEEGCDVNVPFKDGYSAVSCKCYQCVLTLLLELWNFGLSSISRIPSRVSFTTVMFGKCAPYSLISAFVLPTVCLGLFCSNAVFWCKFNMFPLCNPACNSLF